MVGKRVEFIVESKLSPDRQRKRVIQLGLTSEIEECLLQKPFSDVVISMILFPYFRLLVGKQLNIDMSNHLSFVAHGLCGVIARLIPGLSIWFDTKYDDVNENVVTNVYVENIDVP